MNKRKRKRKKGEEKNKKKKNLVITFDRTMRLLLLSWNP